ncbi:MAG TPA: hypothetical protein VES19_10655 [Candidatus Limnocylindrales bacterium]|nr:hypothetical protein [Candidatus Limnocylindrales bacterium]
MATIGSLLAQLHAWVATAGAVIAGLLVLLGALHGLGILAGRRWLGRLVVALVVTLGVAVILGPGIVIGVRPPSDPTHYLYAFVAVAAVPSAWYAARGSSPSRTGWWVAAGGLVTLAALLRLWGTGG